MRRTYDRGRYLDRVALIREHVPDCAITTDIIVGFPGETEADFEQTLEVAEEVGYDGAFTFIYSPAPRDRGGAHDRRRSSRTRWRSSAWSASSRSIQRRARERAQRFVGRTLDVLVEGALAHRRRPRSAAARATTRSSTSTASRRRARSSPVEITGATSQTLTGEMSLLARAAG